ncbi:MAG: hypothetical protein K2H43_04770 [Clostridia bacterium]|nr:hypothetical protein [Clostridia bacterium]
MEKFGIFELLATLSAFADPGTENKAEETKPQKSDEAFAPPPFPAPEPARGQTGNGAALTALLERHARIAKKIDEKKP